MGVSAVACQRKKKKLPCSKWQYIVRHHLWGLGGRGASIMFSLCFQFGPKQEIETPVHEHEQLLSKNGACRSEQSTFIFCGHGVLQ